MLKLVLRDELGVLDWLLLILRLLVDCLLTTLGPLSFSPLLSPLSLLLRHLLHHLLLLHNVVLLLLQVDYPILRDPPVLNLQPLPVMSI